MIDPKLVPRDALADVDVGISVSASADLARLGLDARHAELAIGEIARAVLIAGGCITYGGRLRPSGFTQQLMNEIRRYGANRRSLTIYLALPEHRRLSPTELDETDRQLGVWGRLVTLDAEGSPLSWRDDNRSTATELDEATEALSYSNLRGYMAPRINARVLVGGQLVGYRGAMPGLVEEAVLAIEQQQPLYLAGGFGGTAAAVAQTLGAASFGWLPPDLPKGHDDPDVLASLDRLRTVAASAEWQLDRDGLTEVERGLLAASHRPGEIASLVVLGMARIFGSEPTIGDTDLQA